jgi:hypothetical protein
MADFDYPGPSRDDTVAALNAANIRVIAIKAPGSGYEMDDIAAATGGVVKTTDANSSEIADAIVTGLAQLEFDITANPVGCDPLQISFDPTIHEDIRGGTTVHFEEVIAVPTDIITDNVPSSGAVECTVEFKAGDATIGIQEIQVNVFGPSAIPEASTLILLGSAVSGLAGYIGLQLRARRRK